MIAGVRLLHPPGKGEGVSPLLPPLWSFLRLAGERQAHGFARLPGAFQDKKAGLLSDERSPFACLMAGHSGKEKIYFSAFYAILYICSLCIDKERATDAGRRVCDRGGTRGV